MENGIGGILLKDRSPIGMRCAAKHRPLRSRRAGFVAAPHALVHEQARNAAELASRRRIRV
jgi:hypothetical protein